MLAATDISEPTSSVIIESDSPDLSGTGMAFNKWHYATASVAFSIGGIAFSMCIDSGCTMSLIDRSFLKEQIPKATIQRVNRPIGVRGIGSSRYTTDKFVVIDLFIKGIVDGKNATAHLKREAHLVNNLKAKFLVGIDILAPERISLDLSNERMTIRSCKGLVAKVQITAKDNVRVRRIVRTEKKVVIPPNSVLKIPVSVRGERLPDRDYIFEPTREGVYTHVVDSTVPFVCVQNRNSTPMRIGDRTRVGILTEYEEEECYPVEVEDHTLASKYTPVKVD